MKALALVVGLLLLGAMSVGDALAQQQDRTATGQQSSQQSRMNQPTATQQSAGGSEMLLKKAEDIKGSEVVNRQGERLGKIDSVAIDLRTGRVSYAVLDTGMGGKRIPVPFSMFGVQKNEQLVLNIDKQKLDQAPSITSGREPNWSDQNFTRQVASFWGKEPSGVTMGQASGSQSSQQASSKQGASSSTSPMGSQGQQGASRNQPMGSSSR